MTIPSPGYHDVREAPRFPLTPGIKRIASASAPRPAGSRARRGRRGRSGSARLRPREMWAATQAWPFPDSRSQQTGSSWAEAMAEARPSGVSATTLAVVLQRHPLGADEAGVSAPRASRWSWSTTGRRRHGGIPRPLPRRAAGRPGDPGRARGASGRVGGPQRGYRGRARRGARVHRGRRVAARGVAVPHSIRVRAFQRLVGGRPSSWSSRPPCPRGARRRSIPTSGPSTTATATSRSPTTSTREAGTWRSAGERSTRRARSRHASAGSSVAAHGRGDRDGLAARAARAGHRLRPRRPRPSPDRRRPPRSRLVFGPSTPGRGPRGRRRPGDRIAARRRPMAEPFVLPSSKLTPPRTRVALLPRSASARPLPARPRPAPRPAHRGGRLRQDHAAGLGPRRGRSPGGLAHARRARHRSDAVRRGDRPRAAAVAPGAGKRALEILAGGPNARTARPS